MAFSQRPIGTAQALRAFFQRFTSTGRGSLGSLRPELVPVVQVGKELPDLERPQMSVWLSSDVAAPSPPIPSVGITGINVDLKIERAFIWASEYNAVTGPLVSNTRSSIVEMGYFSDIYTPFDGGPIGQVTPQVRPRIIGGRFTASSLGFIGSALLAPPITVTGARFLAPKGQIATVQGAPQMFVADFGPDGHIVPANLVLFMVLTTSGGAGERNRLEVSFQYRELG